MAEYAERWSEFETSLKKVEQKERFEFKLESLESLSRYPRFKESLSKYMDWRDKALNNALPILKHKSTSITGDEQKDKWEDYFSDRGQEAHDMILSFVPTDNKTPKLQLFAIAMAMQESAFFAKIRTAPLGWFQGKIQEHTQKFHEEKKKLEDKWSKLKSNDKVIDAKIKETSKQVLSVFQEAVQYIATKERHGEKLAKISADSAKGTPGSPILSGMSTVISEILTRAELYQTNIYKLTDIFMNEYKSQETIVIMFTQTREGVYNFLIETNLDMAQDQLEETNKTSLDIAKQCKTDGQRDDAEKFIEKAIQLVKNVFGDFKTQYTAFVDQNRGIFVGPVSDKTVDEILERDSVESDLQDIMGFNIQQKLIEIHTNAVRDWPDVDLNGLTDEQKKELQDFWRVELEKMGRGLTTVADGPALPRAKQFLGDQWKLLVASMKNSKGGEE